MKPYARNAPEFMKLATRRSSPSDMPTPWMERPSTSSSAPISSESSSSSLSPSSSDEAGSVEKRGLLPASESCRVGRVVDEGGARIRADQRLGVGSSERTSTA